MDGAWITCGKVGWFCESLYTSLTMPYNWVPATEMGWGGYKTLLQTGAARPPNTSACKTPISEGRWDVVCHNAKHLPHCTQGLVLMASHRECM